MTELRYLLVAFFAIQTLAMTISGVFVVVIASYVCGKRLDERLAPIIERLVRMEYHQ